MQFVFCILFFKQYLSVSTNLMFFHLSFQINTAIKGGGGGGGGGKWSTPKLCILFRV